MARFSEPMSSRSGGSFGLHGPAGENIVVEVVADRDDWLMDPESGQRAIPPDPRGLVRFNYASFGSCHPWNTDIFVSGYTLLQTLTPGHSFVRVDYEPKGTSIPPDIYSGQWLVNIRSATVSREVWEEPPEFAMEGSQPLVSAPRFLGRLRPLTSQPVPEVRARETSARMIGTTIFTPVAANDPRATNYCILRQPGGEQLTQHLAPTAGIEPAPQNVEYPALQLSLTRIQPNFHVENLANIARFVKAVNGQRWWGAQTGCVLLSDIGIDPIDALIEGQEIEGKAWRVSIVFLWSADPWSPIDLVPLWYDASNQKHIVFRNDTQEKEVQSFRTRAEVSFDELFEILAQ